MNVMTEVTPLKPSTDADVLALLRLQDHLESLSDRAQRHPHSARRIAGWQRRANAALLTVFSEPRRR